VNENPRHQIHGGNAMKLFRRTFLHLAAGAGALPAVSRTAWGQTYPARPIRIIVGFAAGGGQDIVARLIGQWLSEKLGQTFVIDNRPGANGNIATAAVVKASSDGYTLLHFSSTVTINATLYEKLNFDAIRDIAPVASIIRMPQVMEVHPSVPARTVPEFIAYAKANPDKINMASAGTGNSSHVAGELFKVMTGINMQHVPYRGTAPAIQDLLTNRVQIMFDSLPSSLEHIRAGRLRALAVTTATRSEALPEIPTIAEFVRGYEASNWFGIGAPKATPTEIIERLNREINVGLATPRLTMRLADLGGTPLIGSPADFGTLMTEDVEKWAKVIKIAGVKAE
jgi:tripartite-type tricarboxylate transporter receptor subunit TctC